MILCIDIGNTNITHATWNGDDFDQINRITTDKHELILSKKK